MLIKMPRDNAARLAERKKNRFLYRHSANNNINLRAPSAPSAREKRGSIAAAVSSAREVTARVRLIPGR